MVFDLENPDDKEIIRETFINKINQKRNIIRDLEELLEIPYENIEELDSNKENPRREIINNKIN